MIKLLLIGPLPPPMGGDTRHFATLVADLNGHVGFELQVINTSRGAGHSNWLSNTLVSLRAIAQIAGKVRQVDVVSYHASDRGMLLFGPIVVAMCKIARRPSILRVFGGSFGDTYCSQSRTSQWLTRRLLLCCDVLLLQTKRAVRVFEGRIRSRVVWFSTYIEAPSSQMRDASLPTMGSRCRRFVFLGHLWRTKGIETLLESAPMLPADCVIDVYGPTDDYSGEQINSRGLGRVRYCGFLSHTEVSERLWQYDCLVLPTFHPGEGYPGVIAEAFAHELPVITTNWLAIPEIVDPGCGILIEPEGTAEFVAAVTALHDDVPRWLQMKQGARRRADQFAHAVWSRVFETICASLVRR